MISTRIRNGYISFESIIFSHPRTNNANDYILISFLIPGNCMKTTAYDFCNKIPMTAYHLT